MTYNPVHQVVRTIVSDFKHFVGHCVQANIARLRVLCGETFNINQNPLANRGRV
ncbi:hypothetical protein [Mesorhizobium sp. M1B.F.Ca.ET.045.04.1.1]|uniref:hypothetical protein n=1 Tax=Mesorhizobium sp. M1B.F.Ca.ET.045.04.1.1 TaxID=2493673 RepID=UPI001675CA89|nr:hypothetical protein [Mesorhizobium sp. M1B.F.Ca.ET.045.04.1.1]